MKNHKDTYNTLLETLSQEGDSAAFFSRCEPYLRDQYQKKRNNGTSHQEASDGVQAEAIELFRAFVTIPQRQQSAWLEERCTTQDLNENDTDEVLLDKKIVAETASFLHHCSQMLVRTASQYRRERSLKKNKRFYRMQQSPLYLPIVIITAILLISASLLFVMSKTETSLRIMLNSKGVTHTFIIPVTAPAQAAETAPQQTPSKITDSLAAADTAKKTADSLTTIPDPKMSVPTPLPRKPLNSAALQPAERRPVAPVVRQAPPYTPPPAPVSAPPPQPVVRPEPPVVPPEPANLPAATESSTPESDYPSEPASY